MNSRPLRIGIISDTHGLLRPEAVVALQGSDHILHAGDIGDVHILDQLGAIAPVTAVRGNNDRDPAYGDVPEFVQLELAGVTIVLLHDVKAFEAQRTPCAVVVCGHSHRPRVETIDGVLQINPGSAGPRRFSLPVSVARLVLADQRIVTADWLALDVDGS